MASDSSLDESFKMANGFKMEVASRLLPSVGVNVVGAGVALGGAYVPQLGDKIKPMLQIEARRVPYGRPTKLNKAIRHVSQSNALQISLGTLSVEDLNTGSAFSLREYILKVAKQMNLGNPRNSFFSLGTTTQPPAIPLYYLPEMQFVMSLVDISSRLVSVPREGRLKTLSAELTLLNHNLPASICLPLWCPSENHSQRHHRILRLPSNDAVVLNSAERVPFLLQIEILENDCDEEEFQRLVKGISANSTSNRASIRVPSCEASTTQVFEESLPSLSTPGRPDTVSIPPEALYPIRDFDETDVEAMGLSSDDFTERMRSAAVMLAQLTRQSSDPQCNTKKLADINAIKAKIIREMEMLEKNRLLDALQRSNEDSILELGLPLDRRSFFDKEDPSAVIFQEPSEDRMIRIKNSSPFGELEGWKLMSVIVKAGSDMRQEQLACQLISEMNFIWKRARLPLWTCSYGILDYNY